MIPSSPMVITDATVLRPVAARVEVRQLAGWTSARQ